jgi:hypothetical protein
MNWLRLAGFGLVLTLTILGVPGSVLARPRPPVVESPPPPPPPAPMPDVALAPSMVRDAAVFRNYLDGATAISPGFTDAEGVGTSVRTGSGYEPGQLRRGAVAYAAAIILTDQAFVTDVRRAGDTPEHRYAIEARIFADPASVMSFADARHAAGMAKAALGDAGLGLLHEGDRLKQASYDIQHASWSLAPVPDLDARAAEVKALSTRDHRPTPDDTAAVDKLVGGDAEAAPALSAPAPGPYSGLVTRAVALAALAAIGQADEDDASRLTWLTDDYFLDHCLSETKLLLYECLAVARPNYEDVFCLGQHAVRDTGECVARSAYVAVPIEVVVSKLAISPVRHGRHAVRRRRTT